MHSSDPTGSLERWLARELGRPVPADPGARRRIMDRVRAEPRPARSGAIRRARSLQSSPWVGALVAAAIVIAVVGDALRRSGGVEPAGRPGGEPAATRRPTTGDTVAGRLEDTLRLVRFILAAPAAKSVALVGDFNAWDRRALILRLADSAGIWAADVRLPAGRHRYAFVVDDTQWLADPVAAPGATIGGRRTSLVRVAPDGE